MKVHYCSHQLSTEIRASAAVCPRDENDATDEISKDVLMVWFRAKPSSAMRRARSAVLAAGTSDFSLPAHGRKLKDTMEDSI